MRFDVAAAALEGVPVMTPAQGRSVYDHVRSTGARDVLDIGTLHGTSAAYLAAAVQENGGGHVTTVDHEMARELQAWELLERMGLADLVNFVYVPDSSYNWWLKNQVAARSDRDGNVEPCFDFCYLDGSHNFTIDGLAVVLVEKLLRVGGWLLLDDLSWTYASNPALVEKIDITHPLSDAELSQPNVRAVFDLVVRQHPSFTNFREEDGPDGAWGWAQKLPGAERRYRLETSEQLKLTMINGLRRWSGRLRKSVVHRVVTDVLDSAPVLRSAPA